MEAPDANTIAQLIAVSPRLREKFYRDAEKAISDAVQPK